MQASCNSNSSSGAQRWRWTSDGLLQADTGLCLAVVTDGNNVGPSAKTRDASHNLTLPSPFGELYTTFTRVSNVTWYIVTAQALAQPLALRRQDLGFNQAITRLQPYWWTGRPLAKADFLPVVAANTTAMLPALRTAPWWQVQMLILSPELCPGLFFLGETTKMLPVSPQRLASLDIQESEEGGRQATCSAVVDLAGAPAEQVLVQFLVEGELRAAQCTLDSEGQATLALPSGQC